MCKWVLINWKIFEIKYSLLDTILGCHASRSPNWKIFLPAWIKHFQEIIIFLCYIIHVLFIEIIVEYANKFSCNIIFWLNLIRIEFNRMFLISEISNLISDSRFNLYIELYLALAKLRNLSFRIKL